MGLLELNDNHLENLAKSVYDAVNASNKQYDAAPLPKLADKCDPAFIKDILGRLENMEDVLRTEALKTALLEGGPLPPTYEEALNGLLKKMSFWPAKGRCRTSPNTLEGAEGEDGQKRVSRGNPVTRKDGRQPVARGHQQ